MDEKLQAQMEEARAQGYTEEQIKEFLNPQPTARPDLAKDESGAPVSPFVNRGEEAVGTAQYAIGDTALNAAKYAAIGGAGVYGAQKVAQALRPGPVAPSTLPVTGSAQHSADILKSAGGQAPSRAPTMMERGASIAKKMQEVAASRVLPAAAPFARAAGGVTAAVMPGNIGQNYPFPQKGPMRGMEINPATGQPWTPAELQQYNQAY
jgi:hypothetical protein